MDDKAASSFSEWRTGLRARRNAQTLANMTGQNQYNPRKPEDVVVALSNMARLITTISKTVEGIHNDLEALKYDTNKDLIEQADKINNANKQMIKYMVYTWVGLGAFALLQLLYWIFN